MAAAAAGVPGQRRPVVNRRAMRRGRRRSGTVRPVPIALTTLPPLTGRGSADNPPNRFDRLDVVDDDEQLTEADAAERAAARPPTVYLRDASRTVIAANDSPDVGFTHSVNPYRGCAHGCAYC